MNKISVDLKNCYGIKSLQYDFDFDKGKAFLIYAPNGSMKTSLANVFKDISQEETPKDRVFPNRVTSCSITDDSGLCLEPEQIFVVNPYEEDFSSERMATLLVNEELKREYESIYALIERASMALFSSVGKMAGLKKNVEEEMAIAFKTNVKDIYSLLDKLEPDVNVNADPGFGDIVYEEVFNEKVQDFLASEGVHILLSEYVNKYNELIDKSMYFRRGIFNHNNAYTISRSLKENGFFAAKHSVSLVDPGAGKKEISSQKELDTVISEEKGRILNDPDLAKRFEAIDKAITKNAELRSFRVYLLNNLKLLLELNDLDGLKRKLWISYLISTREQYNNFLEVFRKGKQDIERIIGEAKKQATLWQDVVTKFNERFSVPFVLEIANQDDVILKDKSPSLIFRYEDGTDRREIGRKELLPILSSGEKRALYILNVIFEVEARKKAPQQTLFVFDDIADSFDYKNKYAIIEYLKDILETGKFLLIILTHNFDFFRTVESRLNIGRANNFLMTIKTESEIKLTKAEYLDPFTYWKGRLHCDNTCLVAVIPMVRNLIEYTQGKDCPDYLKLTSLLHQKPNTGSITLNELAAVLNQTLSTKLTLGDGKVISLIFQQADRCLNEPESINLENKVVLSIAIRLTAESTLVSQINDPALTDKIEKSQTRRLFEIFREKYATDHDAIALLEQVVMMTPEAIHLNSFMYEPLIDLSDYHLKDLYKKIKAFAATNASDTAV